MGNVVNVGKLMREKAELRVSKQAEEELAEWVRDKAGDIVVYANELAKERGQKTIQEHDIVDAEHRAISLWED